MCIYSSYLFLHSISGACINNIHFALCERAHACHKTSQKGTTKMYAHCTHSCNIRVSVFNFRAMRCPMLYVCVCVCTGKICAPSEQNGILQTMRTKFQSNTCILQHLESGYVFDCMYFIE